MENFLRLREILNINASNFEGNFFRYFKQNFKWGAKRKNTTRKNHTVLCINLLLWLFIDKWFVIVNLFFQFIPGTRRPLSGRTNVRRSETSRRLGRRPRPLSVLQRSGLPARSHTGRLRQVGGVVVQVSGLAGEWTPLRALVEHAEQKAQEKVACDAAAQLE